MSKEWKGSVDFTEYLCSNIDYSSCEIACCENAEELCQRIAEAKTIVSTKMHPLIIVNAYGIPTIGISYNFKLYNFMEMIGRGINALP